MTPIQGLLKRLSEFDHIRGAAVDLKELEQELRLLLPKEKEFAENNFNAGYKLGEEEAHPAHKATYETENPDFPDYFKQYEQ